MSYELKILRRAQRSLARLPLREYERVRDAIRTLADEPRPPGCRKLTGRDGWRIRCKEGVDLRVWNPKILEKPTSRVRLIKLHGSLSWQLNSSDRAEFLAGTFNKMLTYTVHRVYLELYLYFWQALKHIDHHEIKDSLLTG